MTNHKRAFNPGELLLYFLPLLLFIGLWQIYSGSDSSRQFIFSSPAKVWTTFIHLSQTGELAKHSGITILEALSGFILGTSIGALLGLSLWSQPLLAKIAKPYIAALASVPIFALAPVVIVWFGIGILSKIMLAFIPTLTVGIVQAYQGANSVEPRYLQLMQVMGAKRLQVFRIIVVPSALIWVINAMKLNIGLALLGAFIGEFISSEEGLGYMIVKASGLYDMATVFVGVIVLVVIALTLTTAIEVFERKMLSWQHI